MSGSDALDVFRSGAIQREFRNNYPTLYQLLDYNLSGTVEFLKANGAIALGFIQHEFSVGYTGKDDGVKVWSEYEQYILGYVDRLITQFAQQYKEQLNNARKQLSSYIHKEYFYKLPRWPGVGGTNTANIELDIAASYRSGSYQVLWSCVGLITVTDTRPNQNTFSALFTGRPDIRVVRVDCSRVQEIENVLRQRSIQEARQLIDRTQRARGGCTLTWDAFK